MLTLLRGQLSVNSYDNSVFSTVQWRNSGSSLMASELAHGQSKVCRDFMKENFDEVCTAKV